MDPKISVVIPVYKVERYIKKCLDSVLGQSYQNIEVILVDDGSPDNCPGICDAYAERDARVKVIHKKNGGLVSAWMCGLENSNDRLGFVTFVDSDDWVAERYVEAMVRAQQKTDADIVLVNTKKERCGHVYEGSFLIPTAFYDKRALEAKIYPVMLNAGDFEKRSVPISRWGKLIRKQLIYPNLRYCSTSVTYAEDLNIIFPVLLDAESMMLVDDEDAVYFYRTNPSSILNSYNKSMLRSIEHVYPSLIQICGDKCRDGLIPQVYADYLAASVQYFKNELQNPEGLRKAREDIRSFIENNDMLREAIRMVNWKSYSRKLNKVIIRAMSGYGHFDRYIITTLLYIFKKYRVHHFFIAHK